MRISLSILTAFLVSAAPGAVFAAVSSDERAAIEEQCKKDLNITEARLRSGVFVQKLQECVDLEVRTLENEKSLVKLQSDREELVNQTTERFLLRFRGKKPSSVQRTRGVNATVKRTSKTRPSPRTVRGNAQTSGAVSEPLTQQ